MRFLYKKNTARLALIPFAKKNAPSLSIKYLDMLLHAQQGMQPNSYICDV